MRSGSISTDDFPRCLCSVRRGRGSPLCLPPDFAEPACCEEAPRHEKTKTETA